MKCKPGDLAIVVKSACGNEGRIVQVIRAWGDDASVFERANGCETLPYWIVRADRPLCGKSTDGEVILEIFYERPIADEHLVPISGLPLEEEQEDEVTV